MWDQVMQEDSGLMEGVFERLARSRFRARFRLGPKDEAYLAGRGRDVIRSHAADFIAQRLAPALPKNDGKQTPMRGHPAFVAQHATATCCRSCLAKWHGIPSGRELTSGEQVYVVELIMAWMDRHNGSAGNRGSSGAGGLSRPSG